VVKIDHLFACIIFCCAGILTFSCHQIADKNELNSEPGNLFYIEARKSVVDGIARSVQTGGEKKYHVTIYMQMQ
jgi:hypothetical protein